MSKSIPIKTTKTVFEIVEALLELDGAHLSELARHLGMADSTLYDHLRTLESLGYVVRRKDGYRVSLRFLDIGETTRNQIQIYRIARPEVDKLVEETGEHASLMIEENGMGTLVYITKGDDAVNIGASAGQRIALTTNAPGKAILAHCSEQQVAEVLDRHGLPRYTDKTIIDRTELFSELSTIRKRGYAIDDGELIEGVKAISVPIISRKHVFGAITIGGPAHRMGGELFTNDLPNLLLRASNVVELNLTHS